MPPFPSPTSKWHDNTYPSLSPTRPELSAKGKTVVITGGGTGIGAETARYFARAGASRIALLGRREKPLLDTKISIEQICSSIEVFTASTDVMKKDQVDDALAKFAHNGSIDVLISNAAVTGPLDPVATVDVEAFLDAVNANVRGSLNVAQAFLRHAAKDAVVVDVNSVAAHTDFGPGFTAYSVAKMAVARMWNSFAFAHPDMSIFHIQPGVVDTDMNRAAGGVEAVGFEDHVSLPSSFMVWLASPEAKFLKGRFLWANWDVDELKSRAAEIEASQQFNIGLVGWPFAESEWKFQGKGGADGVWS